MEKIRNLLGILFIFISALTGNTQPKPGDVFKEYIWLPRMVAEQGKFLRVGGRLDYKINDDHFPAVRHKDGFIPLKKNLDLKDAIEAEMIIEKLNSHEGTKNLRVSINQHPNIVFPVAKGIPEPESDYMHHTYPITQIPLDQLREGLDNAFRFDVDADQRWNWPQNIIYGVILRIYYKSEKSIFKPKLGGISKDGILKEDQKIEQSNKNGSIYRVEYLGYYDDVNWEGDGIYKQWKYHYYRGQIVHNIGTANMYPFEVIWNTSWIPDQEHIKVGARVISNTGLIYFTNAIEGLKLQRDYSVELCKPYNQPKNWVTRADEFNAKFEMKTDPAMIEDAKAYWVSWSPCYANGVYINDTKIYDRDELCYEYMAHEVEIQNPWILNQGINIIKTGKEPLHDGLMVHGMEVQWPGIMVKVRTKYK